MRGTKQSRLLFPGRSLNHAIAPWQPPRNYRFSGGTGVTLAAGAQTPDRPRRKSDLRKYLLPCYP
ncbi:MAG: hypothetical protein GDA56_04285 [Hormoscilla sp. GM7CHS1pb]|nr:hypothetical protein [Hormoscilla sp. GM7CHS1pb]